MQIRENENIHSYACWKQEKLQKKLCCLTNEKLKIIKWLTHWPNLSYLKKDAEENRCGKLHSNKILEENPVVVI